MTIAFNTDFLSKLSGTHATWTRPSTTDVFTVTLSVGLPMTEDLCQRMRTMAEELRQQIKYETALVIWPTPDIAALVFTRPTPEVQT